MGAGSSFGGSGGLPTRGGKFLEEKQDNKIIEKDQLLKTLIDSGVKISVKDVVFTTKDGSGQIVWLEKGDEKSGLTHIQKHTNDFVTKHNIQPKYLTTHIKNIVSKGKIMSSRSVLLSNGKIGLEKVYLYNDKYYTIGAIGTNGYIVSIYPIDGVK